jgi:hypothetical protein
MILKVGMRHGIGGVSGAWAQHRGMPQFRNSDDKIGPAIAGSPPYSSQHAAGPRRSNFAKHRSG